MPRIDVRIYEYSKDKNDKLAIEIWRHPPAPEGRNDKWIGELQELIKVKFSEDSNDVAS